jgi:hypothetical protein
MIKLKDILTDRQIRHIVKHFAQISFSKNGAVLQQWYGGNYGDTIDYIESTARVKLRKRSTDPDASQYLPQIRKLISQYVKSH